MHDSFFHLREFVSKIGYRSNCNTPATPRTVEISGKDPPGNSAGVKRPLTVMEFDNAADLVGADMPQPSEMLSAVQKDSSTLQAAKIYETTWNWLNERSCAVLA